MEQGLAWYVSLYLSLIDAIDAGPEERPSYCDAPECVSSQRVWIEAERVGHDMRKFNPV